MRVAIAALAMICALPSFASNELSVFISDYREVSTFPGHSARGVSTGMSLAFHVSPRLSLSAAVSQQRYPQEFMEFKRITTPDGTTFAPEMRLGNYTSRPVDIQARYEFASESRWTPRIAAGMRYVRAPEIRYAPPEANGLIPVTAEPVLVRRLSAEIGAGMAFRMTQRTGVFVDVNRLVRSTGVKWHDPLTRGAFGVSWRF
jgi:hypothetical protein